MDKPKSSVDLEHFTKMNDWLKAGSWRTDNRTNPIRVSAVGDIMWIRSGWQNALSTGVKDILKHADIRFANLETPIDPAKKVPKWVYETFHYNAPMEYLSCWHELGAASQQVFSICNNHALDQGYAGLEATRNSVLQQGDNFYCLGGIDSNEDLALCMVKGLRMGFMASTYGINHLNGGDKSPVGVPISLFGSPATEPNWLAITEKISLLKELGAEYIIYTPHWGYEYEYWPDERQRKHALKLIELGVDLILGHSPHVLQPIELISINHMDRSCPTQIERPGGKGWGIIAWSLANFLSIMPTTVCKTGVILNLQLIKHEQLIHIKNIQLIPTYTTRPETGQWLDRQVMCLDELPAKKTYLKSKIRNHCQKISPLMFNGDIKC